MFEHGHVLGRIHSLMVLNGHGSAGAEPLPQYSTRHYCTLFAHGLQVEASQGPREIHDTTPLDASSLPINVEQNTGGIFSARVPTHPTQRHAHTEELSMASNMRTLHTRFVSPSYLSLVV